MTKYIIRYNKTKGMPGRGTTDHGWRLFDGPKEYILKNIKINVPSYGERDGDDWSIACEGKLVIDRETSTGTIEVDEEHNDFSPECSEEICSSKLKIPTKKQKKQE